MINRLLEKKNWLTEVKQPSQLYRIEIIHPKLQVDWENYTLTTESGKTMSMSKVRERTRLSREGFTKLDNKIDLDWSPLDVETDKDTFIHDVSHIFITAYLESIGIKHQRMASELNEFMVIIFNKFCWKSITVGPENAKNLIDTFLSTIAKTYFDVALPVDAEKEEYLDNKARENKIEPEEVSGVTYNIMIMDYFKNNCNEYGDIVQNMDLLKEELEKLAKFTLENDKERQNVWEKIQTDLMKDSETEDSLYVERNDDQKLYFTKITSIIQELRTIINEEMWNDIFDPELNQIEGSTYFNLFNQLKDFHKQRSNNSMEVDALPIEQRSSLVKEFIQVNYSESKIKQMKTQAEVYVSLYNKLENLDSKFSMEYGLNDETNDDLKKQRMPMVEKINEIVESFPEWINLAGK